MFSIGSRPNFSSSNGRRQICLLQMKDDLIFSSSKGRLPQSFKGKQPKHLHISTDRYSFNVRHSLGISSWSTINNMHIGLFDRDTFM